MSIASSYKKKIAINTERITGDPIKFGKLLYRTVV